MARSATGDFVVTYSHFLSFSPPVLRSERSEASVAARGGGYQVKRACVISGDNSGCKTIPVSNRFFTMANL